MFWDGPRPIGGTRPQVLSTFVGVYARMAKKQAEPLVVGTKVRALIKAKGGKMSGELLDALNACVTCCIEKAVERAKANKRTTVKPQDL